MQERFNVRTVIIVLMASLLFLTIAATFFRYLIQQDFTIESKPVDEFTEDDL